MRWAALLIAVAFASGCNEGRFPVCKDNSQCQAPDAGGPVCYNLKCVECRYDVDCPAGNSCNTNSYTCETLGEVAGSKEKGDAGSEPTQWSHGTWDQCAADCKDRECIAECDKKFHK